MQLWNAGACLPRPIFLGQIGRSDGSDRSLDRPVSRKQPIKIRLFVLFVLFVVKNRLWTSFHIHI